MNRDRESAFDATRQPRRRPPLAHAITRTAPKMRTACPVSRRHGRIRKKDHNGA